MWSMNAIFTTHDWKWQVYTTYIKNGDFSGVYDSLWHCELPRPIPPRPIDPGEPGLLRAPAFAVRLLWLPSRRAGATLALHGPLAVDVFGATLGEVGFSRFAGKIQGVSNWLMLMGNMGTYSDLGDLSHSIFEIEWDMNGGIVG